MNGPSEGDFPNFGELTSTGTAEAGKLTSQWYQVFGTHSEQMGQQPGSNLKGQEDEDEFSNFISARKSTKAQAAAGSGLTGRESSSAFDDQTTTPANILAPSSTTSVSASAFLPSQLFEMDQSLHSTGKLGKSFRELDMDRTDLNC